MQTTITYTLDQLEDVVTLVKNQMATCSVITLTGALGAGKTTLVRALLTSMGVDSEYISSPTFTYVNTYKNQAGLTFYHFDLYRIATAADFLAAGFDEYLYQPNSIVLIEWPEAVLPLLTHNVCHIDLDYTPELCQRTLTLTKNKKI